MNREPTKKHTNQRALDETIAHDSGADTELEDDFTTDAVAESLGRYKIQSLLGRGGMGAVYLAHDEQLDRDVALKIPKFGASADEKLVTRFYREARSAATLTHPNLCPVYDVGEIDGTHYIAMAYIRGRTLSSYVNPDAPPSPRIIAAIVRKVALAMEEAHCSGIIHRDLKPANIMIDQRNEPIVMDFGLACPQDLGDDSRLTQDGALLGSPAYMSPEQLKGQMDAIGKSSDIYSLGVVLYELLTGRLPFDGRGSTIAMIGKILTEEPADPASLRSDLDAAIVAICRQAVEKDPSKRYRSMLDFANDLARYIKSTSGDAGTLGEPTQVRAADVTRIQLTEQSRLAKTLCETGQFVAAVPVLQQIIANQKGQDTKMVAWAKATLPKVQAKVAQETKSKAAAAQPAGDDLFSSLPAAAPAPAAPLQSFPRPANRSKSKGIPKLVWIIPTVLAGVVLIGIGGMLFFQGPGEPPSDPPPTNSGSPSTATSSTDSSSTTATIPVETASTDSRSEPPRGQRFRPGDGRPEDPMSFDADRDGRVSAAELPLRSRFLMERADRNEDGFLDRDEIDELRRRAESGRGRLFDKRAGGDGPFGPGGPGQGGPGPGGRGPDRPRPLDQ